MTQDIQDTILGLLPHADPEGEVHATLTKILDQVNRGVLVGPGSRRFLARLVAMVDNIECRHLRHDGMCPKIGRTCKHTEDYRRCHLYEEPPPPKPGANPIVPGGQS
jgi:hypothetical protein